MPESISKEPFEFSKIHVANNIKELIVLCQNDEENAIHYLDNGDFENWLDYLGEFELRDEVKIIRESKVDREKKLKTFIEKCKKIDSLNWRKRFFDFGNKNFWDIFGITIASSVLGLGFFVAQSQIQNQITKSDKEKAAIADQTSKEVEKDKYQQQALDDYIKSITELLKQKDYGTDTFKTVARAKTLTTLYLLYLDKERRSLLLSFLRDANLLSLNDRKIYFEIVSLLDRIQDKLAMINIKGQKINTINTINTINNKTVYIKKDIIKVDFDKINPEDLYIDNDKLLKTLTSVKKESSNLINILENDDKSLIQRIVKNSDRAVELTNSLLNPKEGTIALLEGIELDSINLAKVDLRDVLLKRANLTGADLRESNFSDADMEGAILNSAILKEAFLYRTNLKNARIVKADLRKVVLTSATLLGADLTYSDLREARLENAILSTSDKDKKKLTNFGLTDLRGAWFTAIDNKCSPPSGIKDLQKNDKKVDCRKDLLLYPDYPTRDENNPSFNDPSLRDAIYDDSTVFPKEFDPKKKGMIKLSKISRIAKKCDQKNDQTCNKIGKSPKMVDLHKANLSNTDLSNTDLSNTNLTDANLGHTNLRGTDFTGAKLNNTFFDGAVYNNETIWKWKGEKPNLEKAIKIYPGVNLQGKDLRELNLRGFDLRGANLSKALLKSADLREANLSEADLSNANLQYAKIDENTFDGAYFCGTILPNGNVSNKNCGTAKPRVLHLTLWISDRWQSLVDWFYETF